MKITYLRAKRSAPCYLRGQKKSEQRQLCSPDLIEEKYNVSTSESLNTKLVEAYMGTAREFVALSGS